MIDLLKNYKELRNGSGYVSSIRYYIAKKKLDTLFVKWLSSNSQQVQQLLKKAQTGKLKATQQPNPLFSHHRVPINSAHLNASAILSNTISPPRGPIDDIGNKQTFKKDNHQKKQLNQTYNGGSMIKSTVLMKSLNTELSLASSQIHQFYFPKGKTIDITTQKTLISTLNTVIGDKTGDITNQMAKKVLQNILGLPNYFSKLVITRCTGNPKAEKLTRAQFLKAWKTWKQTENQAPQWRAFWLMSSDPKKKFLTVQDFKQLFKQILQVHSGLQFLKQTPEFQQWYSLCVIHRMFYMANRKYDYKMTFRQFKKSNILKSLFDIQSQPQINKNRDFFSYQDFYVIYIKFWELDNDHDFRLSKEELSKYSGYTLSRKTIERIFSQAAKKFEYEQKMGFGDFVWFILSVQDKTTLQSITYWFKIMDLDANGIITGYELQYFYEQQSQRLAYMQSNLDFNFQNIVCQMVDIFKPDHNIHFTVDDLLKRKHESSVFINTLTDLNKLISFEQRDAFEDRNIRVENPDWTDWDRFAIPQYRRIQNDQENNQGGEVLNWQHDD